MVYRRYKKKSAAKRTYRSKRSYRSRRVPKTKPTWGIGGGTRNFNVLNTEKKQKYYFKETLQYNNIVGAGASIAAVNTFQMSLLPRYNALITMFKKYRVINLKWRFRLRTIELTDQAEHPNILLRYNYDPDLLSSSINENFMLRQTNVIQKQFIHNTPQGCNLEYSTKPAIMGARYAPTGVYKPSPIFNQWCDFTTAVPTEIDHYGIQYWISNLPTGQTIDVDLQITYQCCDLI